MSEPVEESDIGTSPVNETTISNDKNEVISSTPSQEEETEEVPRRKDDDNITLAALAASSSSLPLYGSDSEPPDLTSPSFLLLASLRSQITDLSSQVTSLNSKLVSSYTKIGDLEDDLHDKTAKANVLKAQTVELEKEKVTWEAEIEGGSWIERVR